MKVMTISYKEEYVQELINKEIKRRRQKQLRKTVRYIGYILIAISVFGIIGSVGGCEKGAISNLVFGIQIICESFFIALGSLFAGWLTV